jgi:hypothetical protein
MLTSAQKKLHKSIIDDNVALFNLVKNEEWADLSFEDYQPLRLSIIHNSINVFNLLWSSQRKYICSNKKILSNILYTTTLNKNFIAFKNIIEYIKYIGKLEDYINPYEVFQEITYIEEGNDDFFYYFDSLIDFDYRIQKQYCYMENLIIANKLHLVKHLINTDKAKPEDSDNEHIHTAIMCERIDICLYLFSFKNVRKSLKEVSDTEYERLNEMYLAKNIEGF